MFLRIHPVLIENLIPTENSQSGSNQFHATMASVFFKHC
jgi:hypothetical protein